MEEEEGPGGWGRGGDDQDIELNGEPVESLIMIQYRQEPVLAGGWTGPAVGTMTTVPEPRSSAFWGRSGPLEGPTLTVTTTTRRRGRRG